MIVDSLDAVFYTAIFILPGFIIKSVVDALNPPTKISDGVYFLACLAYSFVNCALYSWAYILIRPVSEINNTIYWVALICITLIGSIISSVFIGILKQRRIVYQVVKSLNIKYIDPTPTAWDFIFSKQEASLVFITLTDGGEIRGWFGSNSFASSISDERDIFIEKVYRRANGNDVWHDNPENNGIYISKNEIKLIEFKKQGDTI